jgi:hypothetical protein
MTEPLLSILIALPLLMGGAAGVVVWQRVNHPALYCVVGTLSLLGLQGVAAPAAMNFLLADGGLAKEASTDPFVRGVILSAAIEVLVGCPLLWWLYRSLRSTAAARELPKGLDGSGPASSSREA